MKKILYILLLLPSCTPEKVQMEDLSLRDGLYYKNDKLFTGKAIDMYDNNSISREVNFVNGVPDGKYEVYGLVGEIMEAGNYSNTQNASIEKQLNLIRISTNDLKDQDNILIHSIELITNQDSSKLKRFEKEYLVSLLKPILDSKIKNRIMFTKGELEDPILEFEK